MVLYVIIGSVVLISLAVIGVLFFMLGKEGRKNEEEKVVPLTDLAQLKKELSSDQQGVRAGLLKPQIPQVSKDESEILPVFVPKMSLPTEVLKTSLEDDVYKKRAQELENELRTISIKAEGQSIEAKQMIEALTNENESLKVQQANLEKAQQKLIELQKEALSLNSENTTLQSQLESTNAKVCLLEEQMAAFKIQMGEEISRANATVIELNKEKEILLSAPRPDPDEGLRHELESLKAEQTQLKQKYEDLERVHQKLRELNTHLIEKNDLLQYELIKARAQSSGLERVSFNYKNQLEDFLKKVNSVQVANEHLSKVKNRLEGMVEQVKLQNEELIKKDQLVQFELEKNRSRLASLEREYEDLKAREQQNGSK